MHQDFGPWRAEIDAWRQQRPQRPEGGFADDAARQTFRTSMHDWRDDRPRHPHHHGNRGRHLGNSPEWQAWRDARPQHPEGGLGDDAARQAWHASMQDWRDDRPHPTANTGGMSSASSFGAGGSIPGLGNIGSFLDDILGRVTSNLPFGGDIGSWIRNLLSGLPFGHGGSGGSGGAGGGTGGGTGGTGGTGGGAGSGGGMGSGSGGGFPFQPSNYPPSFPGQDTQPSSSFLTNLIANYGKPGAPASPLGASVLKPQTSHGFNPFTYSQGPNGEATFYNLTKDAKPAPIAGAVPGLGSPAPATTVTKKK